MLLEHVLGVVARFYEGQFTAGRVDDAMEYRVLS